MNKKNLIILGGTRYIGKALLETLAKNSSYHIHVVSRNRNNQIYDNVVYYNIDINNTNELANVILQINPSIIIDFICFNIQNVESIQTIVSNCFNFEHYIMISSFYVYLNVDYRQYMQKNIPILKDKEYDSYTYNKLKAENMIYNYKNLYEKSTIVRFPYVLSCDDYTGRFNKFVSDVVEKGIEYKSKYSSVFITKEFAVKVLEKLTIMKPLQFIDVSNKKCISMSRFSQLIATFFTSPLILSMEDDIYKLKKDLCLNSKFQLPNIEFAIVEELKKMRISK